MMIPGNRLVSNRGASRIRIGEVIGWHLSGHDNRGRDFMMGVNAILQDETCFFLAVDFDDEEWQPDAAAFMETCRKLDVPFAPERSRSGGGGQVWFLFEEAIPATLARKLGSRSLTETSWTLPLKCGSADFV
jgi:hypothetical protein